MKRNFFRMMAVAGVLAGGCLSASAAEKLRVNVPFSFVLAGQEFHPGSYTLNENSNGVLTLFGEGQGVFVITVPKEMKSSATSSLQFVTDGQKYHLVGYQIEGESARAVDTQVEHKLVIGTR